MPGANQVPETSHQEENLLDLNEGIRSLLAELDVDLSSAIVATGGELGSQMLAGMESGVAYGSDMNLAAKGLTTPPPGVPRGFQPVEAVLDLEVAVERAADGGLGWSILTLRGSKKSTRTHRVRITYRPPGV